MDADDPSTFYLDHDGNVHPRGDRRELALFFNRRWIPHGYDFAATRELVDRTVRPLGTRVTKAGTYRSAEIDTDQLHALFAEHVQPVRPFDYPAEQPLLIFSVDGIAPAAIANLRSRLSQHPSFVGLMDISFPSDFRSVVMSMLMYC